uniref:CARDB domain-containing protein n=1 Tax=Ammonifex degensii TaxID=42838 RepID=A0A7C2IVL5_9THEO
MKKSIGVLILLALLWASFVSLALAGGEGDYLPSPYPEYGAEGYSALNIFKVAFPDTKPGEEEYYFNINWFRDPERGYLSLPLVLPGHGKYTSEKTDVFMQRAGVPMAEGQYKLFALPKTVSCLYPKGSKGEGNWELIPPADDYVAVMANTAPGRIKELASAGIWMVNPRPQIPEAGEAAAPGWLTCYYFYPPDLQVKDLEVAVSGGKATVTATFYNAYIFGGTTDFHLYLVKKDGSKHLLEEENAYIGPWGMLALTAQFDATPDVAAVAASVARPWAGKEWGYGKFVTTEKVGGRPLLDLAGYAVEMGSGAYPEEMLVLMKDRWSNNVKAVEVGARETDVAVSVAFTKKNYTIPFYGERVSVSANVKVTRPAGPPVKVRLTLAAQGPGVNKTETKEVALTGTNYRTVITFQAGPGDYVATARAAPVDFADPNPNNNTGKDGCTVTKRPPPDTGPQDKNVHSEIGS